MDFWSHAVLAGLTALLASPITVARNWLRSHRDIPDDTALTSLADGYAASLTLDTSSLQTALEQMAADAWVVGAQDAAEHIAARGPLASVAASVDWSRWKPGHPLAADLLAGSGFERMLIDAQISLRNIDDVTRGRIGRVLEEGVRAGSSVQTIAKELTAVLGDPERSHLIAVTEVNRAMTQASRQVYEDSGQSEWDLLTAANPCPICAAIAADNPHPMSDAADMPPVHPRCRCSLAAHI